MATGFRSQLQGWFGCSAALFGALALLGSTAAHADTVRVSLSDLPAGLTVSAVTQRTECRDGGITHVEVARVTLAEQSITVFDRVELPNGQALIRPRVITSYGGQFVANPSPPAVRCSLLGITNDFVTRAEVPGVSVRGLTSRSLTLAEYNTGNQLVVIDRGFSAESLSLRNLLALPFTELRRGQRAIVTFSNRDSFGQGAVDDATLSLSLPMAGSLIGLFQTVVKMSVNRAGKACITASGTTRCAGDSPGPLIHGGVLHEGFSINPALAGPNVFTDAEARFSFTLLRDEFAPGTYRVTGAANDRDLLAYVVDGRFQALDLLPWQSVSRDVPVP